VSGENWLKHLLNLGYEEVSLFLLSGAYIFALIKARLENQKDNR